MPSMSESMGGLPLANALAAGLQDISYSATISFSVYVRMVLPLDGFVFWVRTDLVSQAALSGLASDTYNGPATLEVAGSLHISSRAVQDETQNVDVSNIVFTTTQEVRPFHETGQDYVWIGTTDDGIRFGIDARNGYYKQANLNHYTGNNIAPTIETQIIDDISQIEEQELIVSNSLPFFLAMSSQSTIYNWLKPPDVAFYPSYLSPDNLIPPYVSVSIDPSSTEAIQAGPVFDITGSRWQLVRERVKLTFFGLRNSQIMDVLDYITRWCTMFDKLGIMNMPVVKDERQPQAEIGALAIRKACVIDVNYYQTASRDITVQYIKHATVSLKESW